MHPKLQPCTYTLLPIADTSRRFSDFQPYVASVNDHGAVAFQAALRDGGSGVFVGSGGWVETIIDTAGGPLREIESHPDINNDAACCFYAGLKPGDRGVFVVRAGRLIRVADAAGPLGPTMNGAGRVGYRLGPDSGEGGVFAGDGETTTTIAESGGRFSTFYGLPVINASGAVAFRADLTGGGQGVYVSDGRRVRAIAETGEQFTRLGYFPIHGDDGTVAFAASLRTGGSGVFVAADGDIAAVLDSTGPFESFRGVLLNNAGRIVFYATPREGTLGVFSGPDPRADCVIAFGAPLLGSTVADFALNPVSINDAGQLAIRVRLDDGRQYILRADPSAD
ncbi:MAG: hypothetical protein HRF50_12470 [Phycisphaerae bacterium]|jgi:hypothetical protein